MRAAIVCLALTLAGCEHTYLVTIVNCPDASIQIDRHGALSGRGDASGAEGAGEGLSRIECAPLP